MSRVRRDTGGRDPAVSPPALDDGALVAVEDLSLRYGARPALEKVSFAIHRNEIVTLIGPNGAGKTSLVRAVLGLLHPQRGKVHRQRGLTFGYVPQRFALDPTLPITVARFLALPRDPGRAAVAEALARVGAETVIDKAVQTLSGGEFQRIMLARALLRAPDLLVLDEPLQGVDFTGQIALFELIGQLRDSHGFGVLLVSHDLHVVMQATDRVICMNHHICCSGKPETVSQHPEFLDLFGPGAARTLAVYPHHHDHVHDPADAAALATGSATETQTPPTHEPAAPSPRETAS